MADHIGSVARRSEWDIERLATAVRRELGVAPGARIAMQPVLEMALDDIYPGAYYTIEFDCDMGGAEGRTDHFEPKISLSASTYVGLQIADPRARMTVAHELGHLLMHTRQPVYHYSSRARDRHVDPEWQATYFAAALLMPAAAFRKMRTVKQAKQAFGVSRNAALRRARDLRHPIIDDLVRSAARKKKERGIHHAP